MYYFVRSLCCCVRRGWDAGKGLWTRPHSSSSGCSLFCVIFSPSRPSCGRRSDRYEPSIRRKKGFSLLRRVPFPFEYLYSVPVFELQNEIQDVPRFCLFYISFGLEVIALILSAIADISPSKREQVKKVIAIVFSLFLIMREYKNTWTCHYRLPWFIHFYFNPQNPEEGAAFLSRITFNWFNR